MMPVGTPVAACSARRASWASSIGVPSNPRASATATSRAALDDRPAPTGIVVLTCPSSPRPLRSSAATAATKRPHRGSTCSTSAATTIGRDVDRFGFVVGHETDPIGRCPADLGPAVDGHREDEAAGVVGVIADEVHPPGRPGHDPTIHVPIGHVEAPQPGRDVGGVDGIEVLLARRLRGGDESWHARRTPRRHDLDVEPRRRVAVPRRRRLVEPHHVRQGAVVEPVEAAEQVDERGGEAVAVIVIGRDEVGDLHLRSDRQRDRVDRRVLGPDAPARDPRARADRRDRPPGATRR